MNATRRARSLKLHSLEWLDDRITPSGLGPIVPAGAAQVSYVPNGSPLDKMGRALNVVYREFLDFQTQNRQGAFVSSQSNQLLFRLPAGTTDPGRTEVGVNILTSPGHPDQVVADMKKLGMEVGAADRSSGVITGYMPISQLAAAANDSQVVSLSAIYKPITRGPVGSHPR